MFEDDLRGAMKSGSLRFLSASQRLSRLCIKIFRYTLRRDARAGETQREKKRKLPLLITPNSNIIIDFFLIIVMIIY